MPRRKLVGDVATCGECGLEHIKRFFRSRKYKRGDRVVYSSVYIDESGKEWKGTVCPTCTNSSARPSTQARRAETSRKCNYCNKRLPPNRYFNHIECAEELESQSHADYLVERYTSNGWYNHCG